MDNTQNYKGVSIEGERNLTINIELRVFSFSKRQRDEQNFICGHFQAQTFLPRGDPRLNRHKKKKKICG